ncbi:FYVE zinc finger domain-containing protein [Roseomonas sp. NAR14]|uniref:FYVE zinc finger domain-containing protein n=1 Tax=Roseomonas acroporae TaxID=2937791 RepID=A0A9X1YA77_9PROT|nr:FYVE zinc finger domain-containing protein [Roseomonas acroporae]
MSTEYVLKCPSAQVHATYAVIGKLEAGDRLTIPNLTGCMGLICAIPDGRALMVHDARTAYPVARAKFLSFVRENDASRIDLVFSGDSGFNQTGLFRQHGINIREKARYGKQIPDGNSISWPEQGGKPADRQDVGAEASTSTSYEKFDVLTESDARWADDQGVQQCPSCRKSFGVFLRRHHCRNCGRIMCNNCGSKVSGLMGINGHVLPKNWYCTNCLDPHGRLTWTNDW